MYCENAHFPVVKKWVVIGAGGFLGSNIGYLLGDRISLFGVVRREKPIPGYLQTDQIDILNEEALVRYLNGIGPEVVINAAALASHALCERDPDLALLLNGVAPGVIAAATHRLGIPLVHISTDAVFDGRKGQYTEFDTCTPFSVYGETKLEGETRVMNATQDVTVVRTNFFGWSPTGSRSVLEFFVSALRNRTIVNGYTDFRVTSIYVLDLVRILRLVIESEFNGILHIGSSDSRSKFEFGLSVANIFGFSESLILPVESMVDLHLTSRKRDLSMDIKLVQSMIEEFVPSQESGIQSACKDESLVRQFLNTSSL
jgi:dTDP-4-dehydrorhamnose reductase